VPRPKNYSEQLTRVIFLKGTVHTNRRDPESVTIELSNSSISLYSAQQVSGYRDAYPNTIASRRNIGESVAKRPGGRSLFFNYLALYLIKKIELITMCAKAY
jgi:hypothetical protein